MECQLHIRFFSPKNILPASALLANKIVPLAEKYFARLGNSPLRALASAIRTGKDRIRFTVYGR